MSALHSVNLQLITCNFCILLLFDAEVLLRRFSDSLIIFLLTFGFEVLIINGVSVKFELLDFELRAFEECGVTGASIRIHQVVTCQVGDFNARVVVIFLLRY